MQPPPLKKKQPQQVKVDEEKLIHLDLSRSTQQLTDFIIETISIDRSQDYMFKHKDSVISIHAAVFSHIEGATLAQCIETLLSRVDLVTEKLEHTKPRAFVSMRDDSPKIEDLK